MGDDLLDGGEGIDSYVFAPGYGKDTVLEAAGETSLLRLGPGATVRTLRPAREGDDLVLALGNGKDALRIAGYYADTDAGANWQVTTDDGAMMTLAAFVEAAGQGVASVERMLKSRRWRDGERRSRAANKSNWRIWA